jgi:imidazolonepropionase
LIRREIDVRTIFKNIRRLYTPQGASASHGESMRKLTVVDSAAVVCEDGTIAYCGPERQAQGTFDEVVDCRQYLALPGFVDSHTHLVFAGERSREFTMRAQGKSYQEIAAMGGGIRSSVDAVRSASEEEIAANAVRLAISALSLGTTAIEIKSGYGLDTKNELKLLRAAQRVRTSTPLDVVITYLGAHAVPRNTVQSDYVSEILREQLPAVQQLNIAEFCDVFMDEGYFTSEETRAICQKAKTLGLKIKLHADELANTGAAELAAELGSYSADHLLKVSDEGIRALSHSERTVACLLPVTALSIRAPYAPARSLIDRGCAVAIATDCNPGSSMTENMQLAFALAVIGMQMSPEEALTASTLNGAAAIDRADSIGTLEPGKQADFVLYDMPSLEYMPYHLGVSHAEAVIKRGELVHGRLG